MFQLEPASSPDVNEQKAETTTTTVPAWRIGPDAVRFDQLFLIALYSFGDGVCQADIAVDPHQSHQ
jgi:hypothetical protein